jgi:hypothetical protein
MVVLSNPLRRGSRGCGMFVHQNHAARWENGSSWWGHWCDVCFASKNSSEQEFFVPARTHLSVKLLNKNRHNLWVTGFSCRLGDLRSHAVTK